MKDKDKLKNEKKLLVLLHVPAKFLKCMSCSNCVILFYEKTILLSVTITLKMKSEVSFFFKPKTLWFQDQSRVVESLIKLTQDQQEFIFILFVLQFWIWTISNYTKHKQWKAFLYNKK